MCCVGSLVGLLVTNGILLEVDGARYQGGVCCHSDSWCSARGVRVVKLEAEAICT